MMYKCEHCNYSSKRLCDLRRHESRKTPCNTKLKDTVCNLKTPVISDPVDISCQSTENNITCSKCKKKFTRKDHMKIHETKCDGFDKKQCKICLRMFVTQQAKWKHKMHVKCKSPVSLVSQTINNIDNIDNSITNNTINLNIRGNFDKMTKEDIHNIVQQLEKSDYIKTIQQNMILGKYAAPRTVEYIYFNDNHPEMQTLKKERRNDKMVEVHVNGKWEKRLIDDIMKNVMKQVEEYHTEYFKHLEEKFKNITIGSKEWNRSIQPIKTFGNAMIWYEGFLGLGIEKLGIELNRLEDERETKSRNKDMMKLIRDKLHELTPKELNKLIC
uniref:C2H2-type domain-containing protein n=1 Tax=Pyramimonas orientalis virus TaxID=455367 RepID=A0A7M3UP07_POV01|nr:hypothetical protein HWQ62_00322 [Pyramimonas orientalis virus]